MIEEFAYEGDDVLQTMSKYAVNRNAYIEKLIIRAFGIDKIKEPKKLLEFGAGKGEFIKRFQGIPNLATHVIELDQKYLEILKRDNFGFQLLEHTEDDFFDFIYLIDVLEHLEDDEYFLNLFNKKLKKNGRLFIYVPARMELYSTFDKKIGHFRRYVKSQLKNKVIGAGFKIDEIKYHELLGYFASYYNKLFSRQGLLDPNAVFIYDKTIVPVTNAIERVIAPPIGKSLFVIAHKQG